MLITEKSRVDGPEDRILGRLGPSPALERLLELTRRRREPYLELDAIIGTAARRRHDALRRREVLREELRHRT